jgi:putative hemolysin
MGDGSPGPGRGGRRGSGYEHQTGDQQAGDDRTASVLVRLLRALARVIARASDRVTRLVGERRGAGREDLSGAELRDLVANSRVLDREERRLIDDVLAAGDRNVRELMVPRTEAVFLDAAMTIDEAVQVVRSTPHSRFAVGHGSQDDLVGFVHLRDLLLRPDGELTRTVGEIARPVRQLPGGKPALAALSEMRRAGDHFAVVVDEYGGTAGIVTLEDLIEELVGEIHDEYDAAPETVDEAAPSEVDGLLNLADFADRVGFALRTGPYDTLGGYLMASLGRLPAVGDEVPVEGPGGRWQLAVLDLDGRRVRRVGVTPPVPVPALPAPTPQPVIAAQPVPAAARLEPAAILEPAAPQPPILESVMPEPARAV